MDEFGNISTNNELSPLGQFGIENQSSVGFQNPPRLVNPYFDILNSQKNRIVLDIVNNSGVEQTIRLFDVANDPNDNILYKFTLAYSATYAISTKFSFDADGTTYTYTTTGTQTPSQVATALTALGQGTFTATSNVTDGNVFSVVSETVVYDTFTTTFGGWVSQVSGTVVNVHDIQFIDANNGWCCGGSGTILVTVNGGTTWTPQVSGTTQTLQSIFFIDANVGWAGGSNGTILKTIDGGTIWTPQVSGSTRTISGIHFANANNGGCSTAGGGAIGDILHTIDGGTTWTPQNSGYIGTIGGIFFISANTGWAVGNGSTIVKTINGGTIWTPQVSGIVGINIDVFFIDANTGWVASTAGIQKTINGGTTWTPQLLSTSNIRGIQFIDANNGMACGSNGTILKTIDGGTIWTPQVSGVTTTLWSISFTAVGNGWVSSTLGDILALYPDSDETATELSIAVVSVTGLQEYGAFIKSIIQKQYDIGFIQIDSFDDNIAGIRLSHIVRTQDAITSTTPMDLVIDKNARQGNRVSYYEGGSKVSLTGLEFIDITIPANNTVKFYAYYVSYEVAPDLTNNNYIDANDSQPNLLKAPFPEEEAKKELMYKKHAEVKNKVQEEEDQEEAKEYGIAFKIGIFTHTVKLGSGLINKAS